MGSWSAVLPNVKKVHTVKKPKLCPPHARDRPGHVRKSGEPAVLGFQHQDSGQPLAWQKGFTGDSSSTRFFSCKCLAVVWRPAFGIPFHLEVKTH